MLNARLAAFQIQERGPEPMSLGIAFKGSEGLVLAADSRVTLTGQKKQNGGQSLLVPATFDNATKLLLFSGESHCHVAAVTYGVGALGQVSPRTAQSFMSEFDDHLDDTFEKRATVSEYANEISKFFMEQWNDTDMPPAKEWIARNQPGMTFLVAGFDKDDLYGKVFEVVVPNAPKPKQWYPTDKEFGIVFGGQSNIAQRLLNGFDNGLLDTVANFAKLDSGQREPLGDTLRAAYGSGIPYQFLPLQDCVDLSITLIRTTAAFQRWMIDVRGVGGPIDVATITREKGVNPIQYKEIKGED